MLYEYQLQITEKNEVSLAKNEKHITNLWNKNRYKLLYKCLKLYLKLGLKFLKKSQSNGILTNSILKTIYRMLYKIRKASRKSWHQIKKQNAK